MNMTYSFLINKKDMAGNPRPTNQPTNQHRGVAKCSVYTSLPPYLRAAAMSSSVFFHSAPAIAMS
jgi:hypothetical protein